MHGKFFRIAAVAIVCFGVAFVRMLFVPTALPNDFKPLLNHTISFSGTVVADPDVREKNQQLAVRTERGSSIANILVFAPLSEQFTYGEHVRVAGELEAPMPFATDGGREFRYDQYLAKKDIFATVQKAKVARVAGPTTSLDKCIATLFALKHAFTNGLARALPAPYAGLATGLLTGNQHQIDDASEQALELSGLVWVVVLSGYHIMEIAQGTLRAGGFLPRRWKYLFAAIVIALIVFVTGASAPSLRGCLMALAALYADATGRRYNALRAFAATLVLIFLWNPFLFLYDEGFQLSIIIVPALVLAAPILETRLIWIESAFMRKAIVISTVAQLACWPLLLWYTGQFAPWSIPANILAMPLIPLSMLLCVIAGIAGSISAFMPAATQWLVPIIGLPAHITFWYLLNIAKTAAQLPFSSTIVPAFPFWIVLLMYGALIWLAFALKKKYE